MTQTAAAIGQVSPRAAAPARRRRARPGTGERPAARPALRVVPRQRAAGLGVLVVLAVVFAFVTAVVFHVILAQGQLALDRLGRDITRERRQYEQLRLETSTLASPQRIVQEAQRLGLVMPPDPPTYLEVPGAPSPPGERAATETTLGDWKKVKPHLGDEP